jgi:pimeloyl-[acyl-carrier protein] methyl ester esterase
MDVVVDGAGPALVLLHGWAMHSGIFAPLTERLRARFTLHLVDLPGHGRARDSAAPLALPPLAADLAATLPRALWVGWSLGGLAAMQVAQTHPRSVRGLVMLAASPRFVRAPDWPDGMAPEVFERFGADLATDFAGTLDRFLALEAHGSDHMREELRMLRAQLHAAGDPAPRALAEGLQVLHHADLRAGLPALAMPSLWLGGRRDRLVSPAAMRAAASAAPDGAFVEIQGAGHAPFLTHADAVADALVAFAEMLPP